MAWDKSGGRPAPKGSRVRVGPTGKAQRVRSAGWQWSDEAETIFFEALAASCNVTLAASEAGFSTPTVYRLRQKSPQFAERWQVALEHGYARLELEVLGVAVDSITDAQYDDKRPIPRMTVDQVMNVLRAHRNEVRGDGKAGPGRTAPQRRLDDVRASIIRKIEAIERGQAGERGEAGEKPHDD
ncbi:MAG: hypothetical protein M3Q57_09970 [Pseudomonadota bacterium]|nr:hypothetical protein [Pseudomonadota bacterium]